MLNIFQSKPALTALLIVGIAMMYYGIYLLGKSRGAKEALKMTNKEFVLQHFPSACITEEYIPRMGGKVYMVWKSNFKGISNSIGGGKTEGEAWRDAMNKIDIKKST